MKKLVLMGLLLAAMTLISAPAFAVPVTLNVDELYDWGRLYTFEPAYDPDGAGPDAPFPAYITTNSNPSYFGGGTDTPIGSALPANTTGSGDGEEDTWGIGSVVSIKTIADNSVIFQRDANQELTFMFYGFDDDMLLSPNILGETTILSKGGHIAVYLDSPISVPFDGNIGTGGRTGLSTYPSTTESLLVLDLVPVAIDADGHTLESDFKFLTKVGDGAMYLATTGAGAWDSLYDTNTQLFGSDFSFSFTARDNVNPTKGNWVVRGDAGGEGNIIPEPTSMLLFATGLFGLVGRSFRRKVA